LRMISINEKYCMARIIAAFQWLQSTCPFVSSMQLLLMGIWLICSSELVKWRCRNV
jgi:hypothetical protein